MKLKIKQQFKWVRGRKGWYLNAVDAPRGGLFLGAIYSNTCAFWNNLTDPGIIWHGCFDVTDGKLYIETALNLPANGWHEFEQEFEWALDESFGGRAYLEPKGGGHVSFFIARVYNITSGVFKWEIFKNLTGSETIYEGRATTLSNGQRRIEVLLNG